MKFPRRLGQGLVAAALLFGAASPAFAAGTLTHLKNYNLGNHGHAYQIESTFGAAGTNVTASRTPDGNLRVQAFYTDASQNFVDDHALDYATVGDVDIANIDHGLVVTAIKASQGTLKLIPFDPNDGANGRTLTRLGNGFDYTDRNIPVKGEVEIARTGSTGIFVTTVLNNDFTLRVDSWRLAADGTITWLDTETTAGVYDRITLAGDYQIGTQYFVTLLREAADKQPWLVLWRTDANGQIIKVDTKPRNGPLASQASVTLSGSRMYVSLINDTSGFAELQYWDVKNANGSMQMLHRAEVTLPRKINAVEIVDMGNGGVVVSRDAVDGRLNLDPFTFNGTAFSLQPTLKFGTTIEPVLTVTKDGEQRFFLSSVLDVNGNYTVDHDIWRFTY